GRRRDQVFDTLGQRSRHQLPCGGPPGHQSPHRFGHLPVTFDSSQIRDNSAITINVPSKGIPMTTPTPSPSAMYPSVAGAISPPTSAREKMPLKNPGW